MLKEHVNHTATVMIVDDTPGNLALLSDTLAEANYRVLVATDGLSALEQIHYLKPDIILLDVMMPGIDGFETCHRLKTDPSTEHIPILFMTGLSELDDLLRGFGEGAQDYIIKPIRPQEVLARIDVHLAQARVFQRTQHLLQHGDFSALSINSAQHIVWLTPSAQDWLTAFANFSPTTVATPPSYLGQPLPSPLAAWVNKSLSTKTDLTHLNTLDYTDKNGFLAKIDLSQHIGEHLLLLQKTPATDWDLDALKGSLGLTFREAEILMWISRGKTNKDIGLILATSPRTVNKHLEHIFEKLGVVTRAAAVSMVLQQRPLD
ncbi:MAG: response regulator transcription factor [Methylovulum sp.]|jgi:DNA-binding response OmpR family regulator/DNA-binding CsgD family transcriptional regulator|nr:response regulator transcription factor [Methylovulum sp.]